MHRNLLIQLGLAAFLATSSAIAADADPTLAQIYEAANTGQLQVAQQEITQVLRDHPQSGKAHYVQAELYAREGNPSGAREELNRAEQLDPGLPFTRPGAVNELERQIALPANGRVAPGRSAATHSFPWGITLAVVAGFVILLLILRRRSAASGYPAGYARGPGYPNGPVPMPGPMPMQPGYGGPVMMPGGGLGGSGVMGNIATGLAVGAGLAAGEELVHHVFDGNGNRIAGAPTQNDAPVTPPDNGDMGGNNFGVTDGNSWDDSSGGGGGGDWGGGGDSGGGGDWS